MTAAVVRVRRVVYLEVKRVLQVVARLLAGQARHGGSPAGNAGGRQGAGRGGVAGAQVAEYTPAGRRVWRSV